MLRIKEKKWDEFQSRYKKFGFSNESGYYMKKFELTPDNDEWDDGISIWVDKDSRVIESDIIAARYGGFATAGEEYEFIVDLFIDGYVEKVGDIEYSSDGRVIVKRRYK